MHGIVSLGLTTWFDADEGAARLEPRWLNDTQSRLIHRLRGLVRQGDVEITEDAHDRRAKNATLTKVGKQRLDDVAPQHVGAIQRLLFDHLDQQQTAAFAEALGSIAANLCDHEQFRAGSPTQG